VPCRKHDWDLTTSGAIATLGRVNTGLIRIKICGIKRVEDARIAIDGGADALGLLVGQRHASRDFISADEAASIAAALPPFVSSVLVTHLETAGDVLELLSRVPTTTLQAHGNMPPAALETVRKRFPTLKIVKSVHITNELSLKAGLPYVGLADAFLLDSVDPQTGAIGGTGRTHDWTISRRFVEASPMPVILAGGLNAENVAEAIRAVRPFGVDVNSGTKAADGFKDPEKIRAFIRSARAAVHHNSGI
jgi:phosphoribosylanthranilate isomerase